MAAFELKLRALIKSNGSKEDFAEKVLKIVENYITEQEYNEQTLPSLLSVGNALARKHLVSYFEYTEELLNRNAAGQRLNKSINTITSYVDQYKLIGMSSMDGKQLLIPAWQIRYGQIVPGLREVLEILKDNGARANRDIITPIEDTTIFHCLAVSDMQKAFELSEKIVKEEGL